MKEQLKGQFAGFDLVNERTSETRLAATTLTLKVFRLEATEVCSLEGHTKNRKAKLQRNELLGKSLCIHSFSADSKTEQHCWAPESLPPLSAKLATQQPRRWL